LIGRQSQNYTAAYEEYRHRYHAEPPAGFQAWHDFAKAHGSPIIDEFDTIDDNITPFRRLSGRDLRRVMENAYNARGSELWLCKFDGYKANTACVHPYRTFDRHIQLLFDDLMGNMSGLLPNVTFLVNHLDEPRILIPPHSPEEASSSTAFHITDLSRQPAWSTLTKYCDFQQAENSIHTQRDIDELELSFVTDQKSASDLCRHPEYSKMHGIAMSPTSLRLIEGLVPVFSTGSLSTMGDILYPSPAYFEREFQYAEENDPDWGSKTNNLYWAGSPTGGVAGHQWRDFHRQRFVRLAQQLENRHYHYLQEQDGAIRRIKSNFLNARMLDVAFTKMSQCEDQYCEAQRAYFRLGHPSHKDQALRSRLVFDLDGNGISGRYLKFVASKSAPVKQRLFREWHDERLVPWVHFIPVSQSMDELPELVQYLSTTQEGTEVARAIAEQGREWFQKAFRKEDLQLYIWRLMLEWHRLLDPERPAGSPSGRVARSG